MSSSSGLSFKLHPLVIVNISDHYTRVKAQRGGTPSRVIGCLLGCQSGRTVEIFNSFELVTPDLSQPGSGDGSGSTSGRAVAGGAAASVTLTGSEKGKASETEASRQEPAIELDRAFLTTKMEQYKKVFPSYDVLGWYSTGADVKPSDMLFHKALMEINESPIYLLLDATINPAGKDLPISIFESELHVIDGDPSLIFVTSSYTIETVEAERISVDHVAHIKPSDGSSTATQLATHLTGMHSAVKMLTSRVRLLHNHLSAMHAGAVPYDHSFLRQTSSLMRRLPAVESTSFRHQFLAEYNDTLLMTYMASITRGTNTINELVDLFEVAFEKQARRGGRGAFL